MKKGALIAAFFIVIGIVSCSSDEEAIGGSMPLPSFFKKADLEQVVHDGETIEIYSLIKDSYMCFVTSADMRLGLYTTPEEYRILSSDSTRFKVLESSGKELNKVATFYWLTMNHESPAKYVFTINCEGTNTINEIYLNIGSPLIGTDNNIHFVLE